MKQGKPNRTLIETNESGLPQGILTACWAKDQRKSKRSAVMVEISIEHPIAILSTLQSGNALLEPLNNPLMLTHALGLVLGGTSLFINRHLRSQVRRLASSIAIRNPIRSRPRTCVNMKRLLRGSNNALQKQ